VLQPNDFRASLRALLVCEARRPSFLCHQAVFDYITKSGSGQQWSARRPAVDDRLLMKESLLFILPSRFPLRLLHGL
jgi:hypothetical protein